MLVIALNRRKIIAYLKFSLIVMSIFLLLLWGFAELPQQISIEKWNASNDHPGRVLRVNFDLDDKAIKGH